MRIVVFGATGNVGTALLDALGSTPGVDEIVGVARRLPAVAPAKVTWTRADVATDDLHAIVRGADAVAHLAWRIQPARQLDELWRTNVHGSERVFAATADERVPALVYASSVGAYSPGPRDRPVDESWPVHGVPTAFYARHKAEVERRLDRFEQEQPRVRVVRMRTALIFRRGTASEQRRLFIGPLLPTALLRPGLLPVVPAVTGLRFQLVHSNDAADAYRRALLSEARGAFNIAAEPVLEADAIARALAARPLRVSPRVVRGVMAAAWRLRLQPSEPGWLDMGLHVPLMDSTRARVELGWRERIPPTDVLDELLAGLREGAGTPTPALDADAGGPLRLRELLTFAGSRERA